MGKGGSGCQVLALDGEPLCLGGRGTHKAGREKMGRKKQAKS